MPRGAAKAAAAAPPVATARKTKHTIAANDEQARQCGPKNGLCKARACVAARKPLLLGYNPAVGQPEGPVGAE